MKNHWTAVAPVKSIARNGLDRGAIAGFVLLAACGALVLAAAIMTNEPAMAVLGAGCIGVFLAGGASVFLQMRVLTPPAPTLSVIDDRPATVLRREPVAFNLGLVVMAVMGATSLGWAYLATGSSMPLAVLLGALGLWMFVPTLLAASGRFNAGFLALTPDGIDYRSRGLSLWVGWDDIGALGTNWPMIVGVSTRKGSPVRRAKTAGWFTGEKLLTPDFAVLRTDAMSVHEHQLAPVLWRYVMAPAARSELGTPASLLQFTPPEPQH